MRRNIAPTIRVRCILLLLGLAGFTQAIFPVNAYYSIQQTDASKKTKFYSLLADEPKYYVEGSDLGIVSTADPSETNQIKNYVETPDRESSKSYTSEGKIEQDFSPAQAQVNPAESTIPLTSGVPVNAQIAGAPAGSCVLGNTQYTIQVPSGATQLTIVLSGNQDVDLFVRFNQMVTIAGGQPVADYSSTSLSGNETITITPSSSPPLQIGTYFIAIGNCSTATANFTLTATVTTQGGGGGGGGCSGGTALTSGMPLNSQIAGAPAGSCVLGNTQYTIQVPSGATQLTIVLSGNQDVDLFVRFNQAVAIAGGQPVADYSSTSLSGNETITITPSSSPPLQQGCYFIAIGNCSTATANFTLTATVTTQGGGGGGGGCSGGTALTSGMPLNSQIAGAPAGSCVLGNTQYTIQVPANATQLTIVLSGNQDVDLFVRFNQAVAIAGGQPVADHSSTSLSGNETITITPSSTPPLRQGCYFIAIGNCSTATANFTLTATVTTQGGGGGGGGCSGGTALTSGMPLNSQIAGAPAGSCVLGNTQYTIQVPSGATQLTIVLSGNQDVDLFVRFNQAVAIAGGQPVADHSSTSLSGNETITITPSSTPPLRQGCYFIAIGNCSTATANFTLTATLGGPQSLPAISLVFISGKHLIVGGMNFDGGAVIVMNGVDRKTLRDSTNPNVLTGKKLAKKIERGQTVMLQVRNSNGAISPVFPFTRP